MPDYIIPILVLLVTNLVVVAFGYGKLNQKVSDICKEFTETKCKLDDHLMGKNGMHNK